MSNTEVTEKKAPALVIDMQEGVFATLGTVKLPIAAYMRPERTVKSKGGGSKTIKAKTTFRAVVPDVETGIRAVQQACVQAGDKGKELIEKILGGWLTDASESGLVNKRDGTTAWDENEYSKALVELHSKRAGTSIADLTKESTEVLAALVTAHEWRDKWTAAKDSALHSGAIEEDADGNLTGDPFTDKDWADASVVLEREVRDIDQLLEYQLNLRARRVELERQIAEKNAAQEKARLSREANKAKKAAAPAPAPAPTTEPAENLEPVAH